MPRPRAADRRAAVGAARDRATRGRRQADRAEWSPDEHRARRAQSVHGPFRHQPPADGAPAGPWTRGLRRVRPARRASGAPGALRLRHPPHRAEPRAAGRAHHAHGAGRLRFCRSARALHRAGRGRQAQPFHVLAGPARRHGGHGGHGRRVPLAWRPVAHRAARRRSLRDHDEARSVARRSPDERPAGRCQARDHVAVGQSHAGQHLPRCRAHRLRPGASAPIPATRPPRRSGDRQARPHSQARAGEGRRCAGGVESVRRGEAGIAVGGPARPPGPVSDGGPAHRRDRADGLPGARRAARRRRDRGPRPQGRARQAGGHRRARPASPSGDRSRRGHREARGSGIAAGRGGRRAARLAARAAGRPGAVG